MLQNLLMFLPLLAVARSLVATSPQQLFLFIDDCEQYNSTAPTALATEAGGGAADAAAASDLGGPLCGSDGVTYANGRLLRCLNARRPRLERVLPRHRGRCADGGGGGGGGDGVGGGGAGGGAEVGDGVGGDGDGDDEAGGGVVRGPRCPYRPLYEPVCASDNVTYANAQALACRAALLDTKLRVVHAGACACPDPCERAQERSGPQEVVCASNGLTYDNTHQVLCLKKFNKELDVLHDGACSEAEARRAATSRRASCALARARHEWRPLCGSDGATYANLFVMQCYRPEVRVEHAGVCGSEAALRCAAAEADPLGSKTDPQLQICGSDGVTYPTAHHLACAARTNKHLFARHGGACGPQDDPCTTRPLLAGTGAPVCGSDARSYVTAAALLCAARTTAPGLQYLHDGPCLHSRIRSCQRT